MEPESGIRNPEFERSRNPESGIRMQPESGIRNPESGIRMSAGIRNPESGYVATVTQSPDPPLKRSFATFDRGGQTGPPRSNDFFFGAADDTGAVDDRPT